MSGRNTGFFSSKKKPLGFIGGEGSEEMLLVLGFRTPLVGRKPGEMLWG